LLKSKQPLLAALSALRPTNEAITLGIGWGSAEWLKAALITEVSNQGY
jgi:hypothetical protein